MAINAIEFNAALEQIEVSKGISREVVLQALKEAMIKGFKKDIGDDDALVSVTIDTEKGIIDMYQIKNVVEEVEDDLLEISVEDANEKGGHYKVGDEYHIPASIDNLRKAIVLSIKSVLRQKFAEAEKEILYDQFKDKIGTMITGKVESFDDKGASINIGRTSVYMPRKEMIKDERFILGENIKMFVNNVDSSSKGAHIVVSRSCPGFLQALLAENIHDIYDGTIIIKGIARDAGERSKVAVYCEDPNVDPAGSCIGPNGSRIQKVVSQLGNASTKEKIDIITWSENNALFIMEALKPAHCVGIDIDEENREALVIVKDDSLSLAIGKKGVNARLAAKLTNFKIDIKIESEALEDGDEYVSFEEISALEIEAKAKRIAEKQKESLVYQANNTVLPGLPEGYVAPQERKYEESEIVNDDLSEALEREVEMQENNASSKEENKPEEIKEVAKEVEEINEPKEVIKEEEKTAEVKTTTTLADLEASLASESKAKEKSNNYKRKKKEDKAEEEEENKIKSEGPRMSIYTEEELKELDEEEQDTEDYDDEDVDYDQYDDYYDK